MFDVGFVIGMIRMYMLNSRLGFFLEPVPAVGVCSLLVLCAGVLCLDVCYMVGVMVWRVLWRGR